MSTYILSTAHIPRRTYDIPKLGAGRPIQWLRQAASDFRAAPWISIGYGVVVTLIAYLFVALTTALNSFYLVPFLFGGFLIIAPLLSVGLMALAKQREAGQSGYGQSLRSILATNAPSIGLMGLFLLLVFANWIMLSNLLFGGLFHQVLPTYEQVRPLPVMFGQSLPFLLVYGGIALVLALIVFRITALSLPMLVDQKVDAFNASFASWRAVGENWPAMILWAVLIAALTTLGILTWFLGLIVIVPLLGYATWHAYRDTLIPQPSATAPDTSV
jgi:uncharacterized membrane protein